MILKYSSEKIPYIIGEITGIEKINEAVLKINEYKVPKYHSEIEEDIYLEQEEKAISLTKDISKLIKDLPEKLKYNNIIKSLDSEIEPEELSKEDFISKFSDTSGNTMYLVKNEEISDSRLECGGEFNILEPSVFKKYIGVIGDNFKLKNSSIHFVCIDHGIFSGIDSDGGESVLSVLYSPNIIFANNNLKNNSIGILTNFLSDGDLILNNKLQESTECAVCISQGRLNILSGNKISKSKVGIKFPYDENKINILFNNKITENINGIFSKSKVDIIIQNEISYNKENGISLDGYLNDFQRLSVIENKFASNGENGIYGRYSDEIIIKNNIFSKQKNGIFLKNTRSARIKNNQLISNVESGIHLKGEHRYNEIEENFIEGSDIGLYMYSGYPHGYDSKIAGNVFYKNKRAIDNFHTHYAKLCGNIFKENETNIWFSEINGVETCEKPNIYPESEDKKVKLFLCEEDVKIEMEQKSDSEISEIIKKRKTYY